VACDGSGLYADQCNKRFHTSLSCSAAHERVQIILSCHSMSTSYSVVFSTVPLLRMACDSGALSLGSSETQFNAGRHGTAATLEAAHTLGMPWSREVVKGAVRSGCVSQLQWVRAQRCMPLPADAAELAAASGSVPMLRLLQQKGVQFTSSTSSGSTFWPPGRPASFVQCRLSH
jgi:hypothetical protein